MSTSTLLPRPSCCCSATRLGARPRLGARSFSSVGPRSGADWAGRPTLLDSRAFESGWKGKGKAVEQAGGTRTRLTRIGPSGAFPSWPGHQSRLGSIRYQSSQSEQTRYAHESLLSLPDKPSSTNDPNKPGFFSRSANPSKPAERANKATDGLPPPSTSPLVPIHSPLPIALGPTKLSDGMPNPEIRWRAQLANSIADDLTIYKQISKVSQPSTVSSRSTVCSPYMSCAVSFVGVHRFDGHGGLRALPGRPFRHHPSD